jgi:hypothetical protein
MCRVEENYVGSFGQACESTEYSKGLGTEDQIKLTVLIFQPIKSIELLELQSKVPGKVTALFFQAVQSTL